MNDQVIALGQKAHMFMEYPEYQVVMDAIRGDLFQQFSRVSPLEQDTIKELHTLAYAMNLFEKKLSGYVENAKHEVARARTVSDSQ